MRIRNQVGHALTSCVALIVLAGCSGGGSQVSPLPLGQTSGDASQSTQRQATQNARSNGFLTANGAVSSGHQATTPSFFSPGAKTKPLIFVSDPQNNVVDIYLQADKGQKMVGQITGLTTPGGLATDVARNLYVLNGGSPSNVLVYAPPYTASPTLTLSDNGYLPQGVAVSPQGVVGVANTCAAPSCNLGTGNVTFYAQNSAMPCATVAATNLAQVFFDAFDDKGNLYITAFDPSFNTVVGEVKGGCNAKSITLLKTGNTINFPNAIQVDKADRIAILNAGGSTYDVLDIYKAPISGSLGNPVSVVQLVTPAYPVEFAFSASNADVYTAEQGSGGLANTYDFPGGGTAEHTIIMGGSPYGLAVTPPGRP
jgi:hypothetical protein